MTPLLVATLLSSIAPTPAAAPSPATPAPVVLAVLDAQGDDTYDDYFDDEEAGEQDEEAPDRGRYVGVSRDDDGLLKKHVSELASMNEKFWYGVWVGGGAMLALPAVMLVTMFGGSAALAAGGALFGTLGAFGLGCGVIGVGGVALFALMAMTLGGWTWASIFSFLAGPKTQYILNHYDLSNRELEQLLEEATSEAPADPPSSSVAMQY